ncbi:MAG TPA: L-rhamnose mutarotase [Terracidiphilus sp.]|nr:L-rhamnose mutarotase [Terracidiphilus sp.]
MKTYCLALDLHDDADLIEEYKWYHKRENIWPEVVGNIQSLGIFNEEIYLTGTRMVMILHTTDEFSFAAKASADQANPRIQEWEALMWKFQKPVPSARPGEKWVLMEKIFEIQSP